MNLCTEQGSIEFRTPLCVILAMPLNDFALIFDGIKNTLPIWQKLLIPRVHNNDFLIIPCVCGKSLKVPVMFKGWRSKKNPKFHLNRAINGVLPSRCYHKWLETKEILPKNVVNQYCDKQNVLAKVVTVCHIICR